MSKKSAKVLPLILPKTDVEFEEKHFIICYKNFDDSKVTLPCGHVFHSYCVLTWFEKKMECPMCRTKLAWEKIKKKVNVKNNN